MNRTVGWLATLLIGCLGAGCNPSLSVEETAIVPISNEPTIMAFLCPQDSVHVVRVSYTAPAIGVSNERQFRADLKKTAVQLSREGQSVGMVYDSIHRLFRVRADQFAVIAGRQYTLSVRMPGRTPAEASCTIPANTIIAKSITWTKIASTDSDGLPQYRFRWRDFPGEANYYAIWRLTTYYDARFNRPEVRAEQAQFQLTDQGLEDGDVIADPISLPAKAALGNGSFERTEVIVCNTDQTYYAYHRSLLQLRRDENPFSEPVRIASNVIGGYGIMAGYTRVKIVFN